MKVLVTGGAGFVGSHTVDALVTAGHEVRVLDCLDPQVHQQGIPTYVNKDAEYVWADVLDSEALDRALDGVEQVLHLAAVVGVGQSMYEIKRYVEANSLGAACLLEAILRHRDQTSKVVVASSMSAYGEGKYLCEEHGVVYPKARPTRALQARQWEPLCGPASDTGCSLVLKPLPTDENTPMYPTSVYAITKRDHEELFTAVGDAYALPTVALRYFNIYGPRQSPSNPYTGVVAIFGSQLLNESRPSIFEDGLQTRDFIHVSDIVRANILALEAPITKSEVVNVGTGKATSVIEIAQLLAKVLNRDSNTDVMGTFRAGDIRHCFADISRASTVLGYKPKVSLAEGLMDLEKWLANESPIDLTAEAKDALGTRGLIT